MGSILGIIMIMLLASLSQSITEHPENTQQRLRAPFIT